MVKLTGAKLGDYGLVLLRTEGERHVARDRALSVTVAGHPSEIALYLAGRRGAADITLDGDADAIAALEQANLAI